MLSMTSSLGTCRIITANEMMHDNLNYEDADTDELDYGRCRVCHCLEELGPGDLCLMCEGLERDASGTHDPSD